RGSCLASAECAQNLLACPDAVMYPHLRRLEVQPMPRSRYRVLKDFPHAPYFLTCTVVGWLPVFTRPESVEIVLSSWRFLHQANRLTLYGYVILENHLHLIASSPDLSKEFGDFKSFTAKEIIKLLKFRRAHTLLEQLKQYKLPTKTDQQYQLWQEGSHPKRI